MVAQCCKFCRSTWTTGALECPYRQTHDREMQMVKADHPEVYEQRALGW